MTHQPQSQHHLPQSSQHHIHKTSLLYDFPSNQNNSTTSQQLSSWLKQMGSTPKRDTLLRAEWTLMSTNSVFDSFERNDTTSNQQNCQNYANNVNNVNNVNNSNINLALTGKCNQSKLSDCSKSKSYIHAMQSLQKHSKVLETQNQQLKQKLKQFCQNTDHTRSQQSQLIATLHKKIQILEPKANRIDTILRQNKRLRDTNDQLNNRHKLISQKHQELNNKLLSSQDKIDQLLTQLSSVKEILDNERKDKIKVVETMRDVQNRNTMLEEIKQKSTTTILVKYNKSIELTEQLTLQNKQLKQQLIELQHKTDNKIKQIQAKHSKQLKDHIVKLNKVQQQTQEKQHVINTLKQEVSYFKGQFESTKDQLIQTLKSQNTATEVLETKLKTLIDNKMTQLVPLQPVSTSLTRSIGIETTQANMIIQSRNGSVKHNNFLKDSQDNKFQRDDKISQDIDLADNSSIEPMKQINIKEIEEETLKPKQRDELVCLSSKQKQKNTYLIRSNASKKTSGVKSRSKQKQKQTSKSKSKSRSKSKSKQKQNKSQRNSRCQSFVVRSCEPLNIYLQDTQNPTTIRQQSHINYNSANHNQHNKFSQFYWQHDQPQRPYTETHPTINNFQKALLLEVQKQAIRLYEEQQHLLNLSNDRCSQTQRAEYLGRLKQLNEQIKINSEKMIKLKAK